MKERIKAIVLGLTTAWLGLIGSTKMVRSAERASAPKQLGLSEAGLGATASFVGAPWDLPVTRNERVDFFIDFLSGEKHDDMHQWLERMGRYGPHIQEKLRDRGMPDDLIYLAVIESGLDPNAYSRAHAAGIWQFIAETGQRYGLEVSEYVDERRDPIKATEAALDYLEELHRRFGSWYLAAAAYNTGENRVARILGERAGGRMGEEELYWRISDHIPRETRDYVPLMLAAGHIGKDPQGHGFLDVRYQEPLQFREVRVAPGTSLADVARSVSADPQELEELNPHLVKGMTPPDRAWDVRIPTAATFERLPEERRLA